jgi:hypothetical protein
MKKVRQIINWIIDKMTQHEIKIPDGVDYRVVATGGTVFQPQYKTKNGKWKNFTYSYYDQRSGDFSECNKIFTTLKAANDYIDQERKRKEIIIYYRTEDDKESTNNK